MDDESSESIEWTEKVPFKGWGESEMERLVMVDGEKLEVDSRDQGKHTGRNDLLFIEKMM